MTRYHLELLYSVEIHPVACAMEFRENNANADVPSKLNGMASFSKSVNARRKWIVTRPVLSELVSHLIESQDCKRMQMTQR